MNQNNNIIKAINTWIKILVFCIASQLAVLLIINLNLHKFLSGFELDYNSVHIIRIICNCFLIFTFAIIDIVLMNRIRKMYVLVNAQQIKCTVEDFIITSYIRDGRKKYNVYLILKEVSGSRLLFTYGDYSLSYYNYTVSQANKRLASVNIFRKDGSTVKLGDTVYAYVKQFTDVDVSTEDNTLKLNNKKIHYYNINNNYDINVFKALSFYEGAVEVEKISVL